MHSAAHGCPIGCPMGCPIGCPMGCLIGCPIGCLSNPRQVAPCVPLPCSPLDGGHVLDAGLRSTPMLGALECFLRGARGQACRNTTPPATLAHKLDEEARTAAWVFPVTPTPSSATRCATAATVRRIDTYDPITHALAAGRD
eukprot:362067-Chlamydomonas_euryale.AAC.4